ncbi:toxin-antitoxin system HicB family antitoxin [Acidiferrimicrobium sp. IK]|uniref:toxin-antitoxin system HicB family antitoxin n=1 Tax=Acidiferrimicrobium sp. IK TaxID=2871700 RepID=UPI0021CAFCC5|nr:toxin-antitoxin system HicB family antitoxin [Acidiferrimicrobium sp. IK]MCU4183008.1 toxin-antitoxin system HicB family antitoxin [Acidiferrimicrobium sp. IK]
MARVIQIRDVPDDVHEALAKAADAEKLSLNRYVLRELEHLARRAEVIELNARVITETRARIPRKVARANILAAVHEGRDE